MLKLSDVRAFYTQYKNLTDKDEKLASWLLTRRSVARSLTMA